MAAPPPFIEVDLERARLLNHLGACPPLRPGERALPVTTIVAQLEAARARRQGALVTLDCFGGSVTAAFDIFQALLAHRGAGLPVVVEVVGVAASAASVLLLAADHIVLLPWALVGVHGPRRPGAASEVPAALATSGAFVDLLAAFDPALDPETALRGLYSRWTLGTPAEVRRWCGDRMVYFSAGQAVAAGFADEVSEPGPPPRRAHRVLGALARGEAVPSPRRLALLAAGRGAAVPAAAAGA